MPAFAATLTKLPLMRWQLELVATVLELG